MKHRYFKKCWTPIFLVILGLIFAAGPASSTVLAELEDATNGGGFFAEVRFDTIATGVRVTADISDPINVGLTRGDILGLWIDIANESLLTGLTAVSVSPTNIVTGFLADANNVGLSFGGNANINGTENNGGQDKYDIGVQLGDNGSAAGFIQTLSFDLINTGLTEALFENQSVGMRVQSIQGTTFAFGSSKLISNGSPEPGPGVPLPTPLALFGLGGLMLGWQMKSKRA